MTLMENLFRWMEKNLEEPFVEIEMNRAELSRESKGKDGKPNIKIKPTKIVALRATK